MSTGASAVDTGRMMPMDPLEREIRTLLADEAKRQRFNGLSRKIREGSDTNPRTLVAISVVLAILSRPAPGS